MPTLHVLFSRPLESALFPAIYSARAAVAETREELISWIADEALGGDRDAAEWVLLISIARVYVIHFSHLFILICPIYLADNLVVPQFYLHLLPSHTFPRLPSPPQSLLCHSRRLCTSSRSSFRSPWRSLCLSTSLTAHLSPPNPRMRISMPAICSCQRGAQFL